MSRALWNTTAFVSSALNFIAFSCSTGSLSAMTPRLPNPSQWEFPGGAAQSRGHRGVVLAAASPRYRPPSLPLCPLHLVRTGSVKKLLDALCASDEIELHVAVWIGAHGVHSWVGKAVVMERS